MFLRRLCAQPRRVHGPQAVRLLSAGTPPQRELKKGNSLKVRVGGGFMHIDEFIDQYS